MAPSGRLIICQNGYGNERAFLESFDRSRIYHASFAIGFRRLKPHISEVTVITRPSP
jgi:2-dehydropantoate 2-reductase